MINNFSFLELRNLQHTDKSTYENMSEEEKLKIDFLEDDLNEENGKKMTTRNMHAIPYKDIDIKKALLITDKPIEIVKKIFDKYQELKKNNHLEVDYLANEEDLISEFIGYLKQKELDKHKPPLIPDKSARVIANDNEIATNKEDAIKIVSDLEQSQEMKKNKSEVSLNDE